AVQDNEGSNEMDYFCPVQPLVNILVKDKPKIKLKTKVNSSLLRKRRILNIHRFHITEER
ncbi:hypothetical protein DFQ30_004263, partial [Apophysomyces sp. BC1015]